MATSADYTAKIAGYRAKVETKAMPDYFEVRRDVEVSDNAGGQTTTELTVAAGLCKLRAAGLQPSERATADRLGWMIAYAVDLPYDLPVSPSDRLLVDGRVFEIGGVIDSGLWAMVRVAICREVG
jgi:hypothetical protein